MEREEAYKQMKSGKKLKHESFSDGEYVEYKNNEIRTEDGYDFSEEFWNQEKFKNGWSIYNK